MLGDTRLGHSPRTVKDSGIAAIILAGGASRRFGTANKLLAEVGGEPLVRRTVRCFLESGVGQTIVVTGYQADLIAAALAGLDVRLVHNDKHLQGMGTTVATGVRALDAGVRLALITPADLPGMTAALVDRLIAISTAVGDDRIIYPTLPTGEQRNPVLWPRRFLAELAALGGDTGARALIKRHASDAMPVAVDAIETFIDIDRPEDLAAWVRRAQATR